MKNFIKSKLIPALADPVLKKIQKFRDIHKGEERYLFGDGSSLKYFDLEKFSDKISIPCAYLPFHKDVEKLNMPYCFLIENSYFYPFQKVTIPPYNWISNPTQRLYHQVIKSKKDTQFFLSITNFPTVWEKNVTFISSHWIDPILPKDHLARKIDCFSGSVRGAIFLSIYMGFSKIYLVGFDYTHKPSRILHWYEKGKDRFQKNENYQKDFFTLAKEFADIYTVTINETSDFLKPITYEELTGHKPKYRENNEILTDQTMKTLATWPDYTIY